MKIIIALIAIIITAGGGFYWLKDSFLPSETSDVPASALYTVVRGDLTVTITENGSLIAKNSERVSTKSRRGGKITFLIDEGKEVEVDEVLCTLDTTDLEERQEELALDIVQTTANLDTAKTELEIQKSDSAASVEKAGIAVTKAEQELEKYLEGDAPAERRRLEIDIKEKDNEYTRAKKNYDDSVKLLEKNYINETQVKEDKISFERADVQLIGAKRSLEIFDKYTYPMTLGDRQNAVSDAERDHENAGKRATSTIRQREVRVESEESRLTRLNNRSDEIKEEVENHTIKSPLAGIVIYGNPSEPWSRGEIKLGAQIWGGFTLFTIPDLSIMQTQLQIHEADINKVTLDQIVTVTMDTYPGLILTGKVTKIASVAGGGMNDMMRMMGGEVTTFTVEVTFEEVADITLRPGISAKAEIFIEERADILYIPIQCVFLEEGTHYCYIMNANNEPVKTKVKADISNDNYIQITEGLTEGDSVLLYNPTLGAEATTSSDDAADAGATNGAPTNPSTTGGDQ